MPSKFSESGVKIGMNTHISVQALCVMIVIVIGLAGSASAAYISIIKRQTATSMKIDAVLEHMAKSDIRVAEINQQTAVLEKEILFMRRDLDSQTADRWTKAHDRLFMTEYSAANNLNMTNHERE